MARAHLYLPRVVARVLNTGAPLVVGDVGGIRDDVVKDDEFACSFAIVAAPIKRDVSIMGAACIFADGPLAIDDDALARFEVLAAAAYGPIDKNGTTEAPPGIKRKKSS